MKRYDINSLLIVIALTVINCFDGYSQSLEVKRIDMRNECIVLPVDTINWDMVSRHNIGIFLNENLYAFYNLHERYPSALQRKQFEQTEEYNKVLLPKFKEIVDSVKNSYYIVTYSLHGNKNYDVDKDCFTFRINPPISSRPSLNEYLHIGDYYCVRLPSDLFQLNDETVFGKHVKVQYFTTPPIAVEKAIRIEEEMRKRDCAYSLFFIVKLDRQHEARGDFCPITFNLLNPVKCGIIDANTHEVIENFEIKWPLAKTATTPKRNN